MRAFLLVLDSVGIGAAPDAADFGDTGSATLPNTAAAAGGLRLPSLERMGLGCIPALLPGGLEIQGVNPVASPAAGFGAMRPMSPGKDTTTGHWEICGLTLDAPFHVFPPGPPSFPRELTRAIRRRTGRDLIGNKASDGVAIIEELGAEHIRTGALIAYTSADSVFQVAAHEEVVPLAELYACCVAIRKLCDPYRISRVIARPFTGRPGAFMRTPNRRDFSIGLPGETVLDRLSQAGIPVVAVGKIWDIFNGSGITESFHTGNNAESQAKIMELAGRLDGGLLFANLIDFDMLYGHRRDPAGYAGALEAADSFFGELAPVLRRGDLLIVTADHGNDPTFKGTDHTREYVPLLALLPGRPGRSLGVRLGFHDVAQSLAGFFGVGPMPGGESFLD